MQTNNNIYGVTYNGVHTDISRSLIGTKQYATKHDYDTISIRYNCGYNVSIVAKKVNKIWVNQDIIDRIELIREEIQNERISYGEIFELISLKKYIDKNDVELLQWCS
jgi:hypothetical protein